ncbi:MAG: NlpC/P60 family protein [Dinoroseobacter sp.]|nr:NlpC/P60 family protein [Dinoroseobacter sp.]MDJ0992604.1 NlpC/P60 family protein [Dinoroseobacter sp.]
MSVGDKVIAAARGWLGTPYVHQANVRGAGCDCLGLIRGIWTEIYGAEPEPVPPYTADWSEPQRDEVLWRAAARNLLEKPLDAEAVGDLVLFRMRDGTVAKHLGIQSTLGSECRFIHAYMRHGVVESPLSGPWLRRIVARFSFPDEVF